MNQTEYLEKELNLLLGWIQAADTRISLVLPLSSAMLGTIAALAPEIDKWVILSAIAASFATFFLVLSLIFSAIACFPRIDGPKGSMIFFTGITSRELAQYKKDVSTFSEKNYIDDLSNQCHINAQIANIKFSWVKRSMACLFIAALPWFASIFLLYGV